MGRIDHHQAAFFFAQAVETPHQIVPIGVQRQHRERQQDLAALRIDPAVPQPCDMKGRPVQALDAPAHRAAGAVVGLVETVHRQQAPLAARPGLAERRLLARGLAARVVRGAGNLAIARPERHQAKTRSDAFARRVAATQQRRRITRPGFFRVGEAGCHDAHALRQQIARGGAVVGAHGRTLSRARRARSLGAGCGPGG